ncbi:hypothetical protein [Pleomorphovibrio marinus]|uniref:hypothetical protein n=1 Tax=Pleomorphovibrio marinus TaxID=2164132 RepID=UPI000E0B2A85|nr:hypothetical protein [Pleomorphovibrio marinus]
MRKLTWIYGAFLILFSGCGLINIKKTGGAERFIGYTEDLESSRIRFEDLPEPSTRESGVMEVSAVDADLNEAIQSFIREKERNDYISGFTILVYSGVDREEAFKTRNTLYTEYEDILTFMQYQQPRYLVKVGKYINRIEALAWYERIKEEFPSARIIQDRFEREKVRKEREQEETIEDVNAEN